MSIILTSEDHLPPGRLRCSIDEVRDTFVTADRFAGSVSRTAIWQDWLSAVEMTREVTGHVCAAWVGGSFVSGKHDPSDIDSVFVIESTLLDNVLAAGGDPAKLLSHIARSNLRSVGMKVDSYVMSWVVNPEPGPTSAAAQEYLQMRGYWDDFWQRVRSGGKNDPPCRKDALPLRGYVEVILDGFPE